MRRVRFEVTRKDAEMRASRVLWHATYQADYTVRESERDAYRDLDAGVVGAFRNPSAHQFVDPTPHEGSALIAFVNLLLKKLEALR